MSASGFSYAQAARGQPTPAAAAPTTPKVPASAALQDKDGDVSSSAPLNTSALSADSVKTFAKASANDSSPGPGKLAAELPPSPAASSTLIGTTAESSSSFSLDDAAHAEKPSRISTPGTRSPPSDEVPRKGSRKAKPAVAKSTDKDTAAQGSPAADTDNEPEVETPKVELAPAPVPAVNIWSQRMLEHAAKAKQAQPAVSSAKTATTTGTIPRSAAAAPPSSNGTNGKDGKKTATLTDTTDASGTAASSGKPGNRRPTDNGARSGADPSRRNGPRGARSTEKDDRQPAPLRDALPSVNDATSWPTPESSIVPDDVKAKVATDKPEAVHKETPDETGSLKSRKKGWVHMPFVPTVNFQTPIPSARGPKPKSGARGARDPLSHNSSSSNSNNNNNNNGHNTGNNAAAADKATPGSLSAADNKQDSEARDATRETSSSSLPNRPSAQPFVPHKRSSVDMARGPSREPRKPLSASLPDKPKEIAMQGTGNAEHGSKATPGTSANGDPNGPSHQTTHHPHERRAHLASKSGSHHPSFGKEFTPQEHKEHHPHNRPGRGGFRGGRGGGPAQNQHMGHSYQANGQRMGPGASHSASSSLPPTAAPFHPPSQPLPTSQQFPYGVSNGVARPSGRASARPQAASQPPVNYGGRPPQHSNHRMFMHGSHGANVSPVEYQPPQYAYPSYNPYMDPEILHGLTVQVEYYFSLDNLCKDFFLRKKMNDQGFVPLSTIAKFKRMLDLAPSIDFVRAACEQSENLDYVVDHEQNEWIRSRLLWGNFVLPPDERDEDARKPGPDLRTVFFRSAHSRAHQHYAPTMMASGYPSMQPAVYAQPAYPVAGQEALYSAVHGSYGDYAAQASGSGSELNGRPHRAADSQLSASVPDFSPGGSGRGGGAPMTLEDYQTYPDEQVEKLVVLVRPDLDKASASASSTDVSATDAARHSGQSQQNGSSSTNGIAKETTAAKGPLQDGNAPAGEAPYPELRTKALQQRASATARETPDAMVQLYRFWSHCLPDKFNVRMYEDFRSLALEDARRPAPLDFGLKCLIQYYDQVLFSSNSARPYPAVFVPHHAEARKLLDLAKAKATANGESRD